MNQISTSTDVVNSFVAAVNQHNAAALALLFHENAVVVDDGQEYADEDSREKWILEHNINPKLELINPKVTVEPQDGDANQETARMVTSVIGDFPGGPLRFAFRFTVAANLIERLEISATTDGE